MNWDIPVELEVELLLLLTIRCLQLKLRVIETGTREPIHPPAQQGRTSLTVMVGAVSAHSCEQRADCLALSAFVIFPPSR